jgi:pyroglutamyl-peptidase
MGPDWRRNWTNSVQHDVRISEDAGRYLCDFIYYSSLAELTKRGEEKRVLFLHVPVDSDGAAIERGVDVTVELIRSMVQSSRMKKTVGSKEITV